MKFREKYAVKIDLWDAIAGGLFLYFSIYLLAYAFGFVFSGLFGVFYPNVTATVFSQITTDSQYWLNASTMPFILAFTLALALFTFLIIVLYEEHYFSKHEKATKDLVGLGIIWGAVFVTTESIMNAGLETLGLHFDNLVLPVGIRTFTGEPLFWLMVIYIVALPWLFHYSRKVKARG